MRYNDVNQTFAAYQRKRIIELNAEIARLAQQLDFNKQSQDRIQPNNINKPIPIQPEIIVKTDQKDNKLIDRLNLDVVRLTEQVKISDNLRKNDLAKVIDTISKRPAEQISVTNDTVEYWNLPYVFEINSNNENEIEADTPFYLYVKEDKSRGLKVPGRGGYIKNDGPGKISYKLNNGKLKGWSHPATILSGEMDTFDFNDNVQIISVEITADTNKTHFRARFTPGLRNGIK